MDGLAQGQDRQVVGVKDVAVPAGVDVERRGLVDPQTEVRRGRVFKENRDLGDGMVPGEIGQAVRRGQDLLSALEQRSAAPSQPVVAGIVKARYATPPRGSIGEDGMMRYAVSGPTL